VADDDRAVLDKLAALDAEVKAEADAHRARKEAALAKLRAQKAAEQAEREATKKQQALVPVKKRKTAPTDDVGSALELAGKANQVKQELARKPGKGEKSWIKSGIASMALGPVGWLYAGSLREAVPAATVWLALLALATKILPTLLIMPALFVVLPLSGIAGIVYALQYNRHGGRQRLFGDDKKQLPGK
jgi:hypothetical protein